MVEKGPLLKSDPPLPPRACGQRPRLSGRPRARSSPRCQSPCWRRALLVPPLLVPPLLVPPLLVPPQV